MTTAHREDGFTFHIWSNDHAPAHVHARKGGAQVVVTLELVAVREVRGMKPADVVRAVRIVIANRAELLKVWRELHGE